MKKQLRVALAVLFIGLSSNLWSATMHAILVGDTRDSSLGNAFATEVTMMQNELQTIANKTGMQLTSYVFVEFDTTVDNVMKAVKKLKVKSDDVVFIYFGIHGYRNPSKKNQWPSLYFGVEKRGLDFHFVNKTALAKKPRLLISIADSCNSTLAHDFPTVEKALPLKDAAANERANYEALFLRAKGSVIVSSSQPGEYSWAYVQSGGIWSNEFIKVLRRAVARNEQPSWEQIMSTVGSNVIDIRLRQKGPLQHAQYEIKLEK